MNAPAGRAHARRRLLGTLAALACGAAALSAPRRALAAAAAAWPNRPLRWIVAYAAGGGSDFLARILSPAIAAELGATIVVENRPGAAGIIGTTVAARAPADGYTLLSGDNGVMVFNAVMYRKLSYAAADFAPVGMMARLPLVLVAAPAAGFASAHELIAAVRAEPGRYAYASPGVGSPHHLAMELLAERAGLSLLHVPYRGTQPAMQDVAAGQVAMMVTTTAAGLAQMRSGALVPLAVLQHRRLAALPEVPTIVEAAGLDVDIAAWHALFVPASTSPAIVARLALALRHALGRADVGALFAGQGMEAMLLDGAELAAFLRREVEVWSALIRQRHLAATE